MRRYFLLFLASLHLCRARQPGFSIHDDMLAYPQFEVIFSDTFVSELDAQRLIESSKSGQSRPTYTADASSQTGLTSQPHESARAESAGSSDAEDAMPEISEDYEIMSIPPSKYLCTVPVLAPPPAPNQTAAELAKAEETRELARANSRGWELMSALDDQCLFFVSGWWSYRFCYGHDIVQFHALPSGPKGSHPVRDPNSQEYVLGRVPHVGNKNKKNKKNQESNELQTDVDGQQKPLTDSQSPAPPNTELQVKGDQRFLVQRMGAGTLCDLTGRERTIEVQYHCNPGSAADRIGWIKEITTCSYLMLINTPRLCEDVAFLPPKETRAHSISCQRIIESEEELAAIRLRKSIEAAEELGEGQHQGESDSEASDRVRTQDQRDNKFKGMEIGGIIIGGNQLHNPEDGQPAPTLKPPKGFLPGKGPTNGVPLVETLAKALSKQDGGQVEMMTDEQLEQLNLNPDAVEQFRKELEKIAGEKGWTLEVVEMPGEIPEIRGIVEDDEEEAGEGEEGSEEKFFKEEL
ncbi:Protein OS-9 [Gnomoniopsis sp. IMI 355080]|nr:Protein OS-9 [Gnomoniopsis sp. IMI 355080]